MMSRSLFSESQKYRFFLIYPVIYVLFFQLGLSMIDSDFDGFCEDADTTCQHDFCSGSVERPLSNYGCDATQENDASCEQTAVFELLLFNQFYGKSWTLPMSVCTTNSPEIICAECSNCISSDLAVPVEGYGKCSDGTQKAECRLCGNGVCDGGEKSSTCPSDRAPYTFSWFTGDWGECQPTNSQTREVYCKRTDSSGPGQGTASNPKRYTDSHCSQAGEIPPTTQWCQYIITPPVGGSCVPHQSGNDAGSVYPQGVAFSCGTGTVSDFTCDCSGDQLTNMKVSTCTVGDSNCRCDCWGCDGSYYTICNDIDGDKSRAYLDLTCECP
jgi:hypothetical protein